MNSLLWGGDFPITQRFGMSPAAYAWIKDFQGKSILGHNGLDVGLPNDTPLYAPFDCTVLGTGWDEGGYGHFVRLSWKFTDGQLLLGHMRSRNVSNGQQLTKGALLGLSDNTGWSTGPHTHVGYRPPGWSTQRTNGYDGWTDPYPALMALLAEENDTMARLQELQGQLDQANGINAELQRQVAALREEVAVRTGERDAANAKVDELVSTVAALQEDVEKPLRAEVASLKLAVATYEPRIAEMEDALRQAMAQAAKAPTRVEVELEGGTRLGFVREAA